MTNEAADSDDARSSNRPMPGSLDHSVETGAAPSDIPIDTDAGYRLADAEVPPIPSAEVASAEAVSDIPKPEPETTFQSSSESPDASAIDSFPDPAPEVRDVWTRWSDWRQPALWMAAGVGLAILIVLGGRYVATLSFVAGMTYGSYRLVTSLEVPVRVTPEQAIQEFFGAAGHRLPNFDRMYALLTADGKQCDTFRNSSEFRTYWTARMAQFARAPIWLVPLEFRVQGFTCRYNGDKSMASVRYTISVGPRNRPNAANPDMELAARNLVVKGPDAQWYVNDGCLPDD